MGTNRTRGRRWARWLAWGVGLATAGNAWAQAPEPPPQGTLPPKSYMNKNVFYLPVSLDERTRATLQEIQLYCKQDPAMPWTLKERIAPNQNCFSFKAARDGEYWFTVVTVDRSGRMVPPDLTHEPPGVIVVLDSQPPQVDVSGLPESPEGPMVKVDVRDTNFDPSKTKFYYQTGDMVWRSVEAVPGRMDQFCVPKQAVVTGMVKVVCGDFANNIVTREVNLSTLGGGMGVAHNAAPPTAPSAPPSAPPSGPPPSVASPSVASPSVPAAGASMPNTSTPSPLPPAATAMVEPKMSPAPAPAPAPASPAPVKMEERQPSPLPAEDKTAFVAAPPFNSGPPLPPPSQSPEVVQSASTAAASAVSPSKGEPVVGSKEPVIRPTQSEPAVGTTPEPVVSPRPVQQVEARAPVLPAAVKHMSTPLTDRSGPAVITPAIRTDKKNESTHALDVAPFNKQVINQTHVVLEYQIEQMGPSGVGKVEIWMTRDQGQTWQKHGEDVDRKSPAEFDLPGEGLYGISLIVSNGRGFGGNPPNPGDMPDWWIEADLTKPVADLLVAPGSADEAGALHITWNARDKNLGPAPIDLYYAAKKEGLWHPIVKGLRNDGHYRWPVPGNIGAHAYIRLVATDLAGNSTTCETPRPVPLDDLSRPRGRVTGISTPAPTRTSQATQR